MFCAARKDFLDRFVASSREEQSAMSVEWSADDGASLNSVANELLEDLTTFISVAKDINKSELGELAAPPRPLYALDC
ncbi:hypothetical protein Pmar_PMAR026868 [Perkinsus marinus ATCC 50983]|uniref:Uncharacterized protein n=1 Tax=Perkinsus marinus (strain ATCC 50983 / TXsc) TaxID=423536 RepID=C5LMN1_PERM5|nr:hypothetical protein Pmar_PMAR026868 [Perkinsus marinus ATCC 50983]EER02013.1 hypothetical protein Pmar_PMAR026868 [Perkinsus marinus ATCC 50983]|eukprot:XP_002769295.1 hypothetical protein Pmar_PMAR026868 [Perkinsus marinus ATCC 50983]